MEECEHEWYMFDGEIIGYNICFKPPKTDHKWYRRCKLCNKLESFTLENGKWEHKVEKEGIPI